VTNSIINTQHCRDLLHKRYTVPEWALFEEVAPRTGRHTRYADAIAVNLWQSRGYAIHGFEIKTARSDWLRELKDPEKAEPLYRYCDHWWIVAPKGIVKEGELPPNWGLMEAHSSRLEPMTASPKLTPTPIEREFFASLIRRGREALDAAAERMTRDATNSAIQESEKRIQQEIEFRTRRFKDIEKSVAEFEKETGIGLRLRHGIPPVRAIKIAQQLVELESYDDGRLLSSLNNLASRLATASETVREAIRQFGSEFQNQSISDSLPTKNSSSTI